MTWMHLRTLVVITDADGALAAQTLRPKAADLDVGLRHADVGEEKPGAEDGLREDVQDGLISFVSWQLTGRILVELT